MSDTVSDGPIRARTEGEVEAYTDGFGAGIELAGRRGLKVAGKEYALMLLTTGRITQERFDSFMEKLNEGGRK